MKSLLLPLMLGAAVPVMAAQHAPARTAKPQHAPGRAATPQDPAARSKALAEQALAKGDAGDPAAGLVLIAEARRLDPKSDQAIAVNAQLLIGTDRPQAKALAAQALAMNPNNDTAYWTRGWIAGQEGDWAGEAADMTRVTQLKPRVWQGWLNAGHALFQLGKTDEAIAMFQGALRAWPGARMARTNLAVAYARRYAALGAFNSNSTYRLGEALLGNVREDSRGELRQMNPDVRGRIAKDDNAPMIVEAAKHSDLDMIDLLVARGADINAAGNNGQTALSIATFAASSRIGTWSPGAGAVAFRLLELGADPMVKDADGKMPIYSALLWNNQPLIRALLRAGTPVNEDVGEGYSAFALCAEYCSGPMLAEMASAGGNMNTRIGDRPLIAKLAEREPLVLLVGLRAGGQVNDIADPETRAWAQRVMALPPASPAGKLASAIADGRVGDAFGLVHNGGVPKQALDDLLLAAIPLDDGGLVSALLAAGADGSQTRGGNSLTLWARNMKWEGSRTVLGDERSVQVAEAAESRDRDAHMAARVSEITALVRQSTAAYNEMNALVGTDIRRAPSAEICRLLFQADNAAKQAITKGVPLLGGISNPAQRESYRSGLTQLRDQRNQSYSYYQRFSCKFYWQMTEELPNFP